jgi:hypothetical protein
MCEQIQLGNLDQRIVLIARSRHFGGRQWYFMCPAMNRPVSVLWKPPGASRFCSRQKWGRGVVAYQSRACGPSEDQVSSDRRVRSGRMGLAAETEMDEVAHVQPLCPALRPLRGHPRGGHHPVNGQTPRTVWIEDWPAGAESKSLG